ncbi:MAG TPA: carbon-nitrogen hydrolase, partial [Gemmatimonadaceae bacterium]
MPATPFTVGLIQQAVGKSAAATVDAAERGIREAAGRGAQIICLQELFNAPYFCKVTDAERFDLAEPIPGPTVERMQSLAAELEVVIIVPLFERRGPGLYHNSAAVLDADGSLLGTYRKMHIPDDPLYHEKYYFTPGEIYQHDEAKPPSGFRVFRTRYATIGVLICWDQWYPEAARITSLMGAEILFYPTAIGWHPKEKAAEGTRQHGAWELIQRSHAVANGCYVAVPNRVGVEQPVGGDGIEFWGQSFVCGPDGEIIAKGSVDGEEIVAPEIDWKRVNEHRTHWPFLRDRRIDAYTGLQERL